MPGPWEKYQAQESGPWQKYQAPKSDRPKYTEVESAALGAAQGVSLGFADEIEGAVRAGKDAVQKKVKGLDDLVSSYRNYRDQARTRYDSAREDNPVSYTGGEVAGSVGSAVVPGLGFMQVGKGASALKAIGTAAKGGAVIGAGTSRADLTKGETEEFKSDVLTGAALGAGTQGALSAAGPVAKGIGERFKNIPEERAVKAVTGQNISALRQISNTTLKSPGDIQKATDQIRKVGRDILDEPGVLGPLSKVEDIAPKLSGAREKYGKLIGEVGKQIDDKVPNAVSTKNIADDIVKYAETIPETLQGQKLKDKLVEEAANFEKMSGLSFADAQKFKNQFKYKAVDADALISNQDATNKVRDIISKEMEKTVDTLSADGSPLKGLVENYKLYKSKYGSFKKASDAATDRAQKNLTNRWPSPSDYGIGSVVGAAQSIAGGGIGPGTVALGAGAAMANKFARERGSALAAKTADTLIKTFESEGVQSFIKSAKPIIDMAKKGNPAAILTFQVLSQKNPQAFQYLEPQGENK